MKIWNAVLLLNTSLILRFSAIHLCLGLLLIMPNTYAQKNSEFRGVWVASVDNIDWPAKGNYNADSQKTAFIQLLDMHKANGMNAMVVQIRPATDAFYPSP
jgi:uncharacterized lipoprotein YddW (UPF0748 family)